jgi:hypothetical protein
VALEAGYDQALREVYQIQNVGELERSWRQASLEARNSKLEIRNGFGIGASE